MPAEYPHAELDPVAQARLDALGLTFATDAEMAGAVAALQAVDALKQDAATAATDAELAAIEMQDFAGLLTPNFPGRTAATLAPVANRLHLGRFVPPRDITVHSIRHVLATAAGANDSIDLGILDANGDRLTSTGATAGKTTGATGAKSTGVPQDVVCLRGVPYYAAFAHGPQGGAAPTVGGFGAVAFGLSGIFAAVVGTTERHAFVIIKDNTYPIPAHVDLATCNLTGGAAPALALMEP